MYVLTACMFMCEFSVMRDTHVQIHNVHVHVCTKCTCTVHVYTADTCAVVAAVAALSELR